MSYMSARIAEPPFLCSDRPVLTVSRGSYARPRAFWVVNVFLARTDAIRFSFLAAQSAQSRRDSFALRPAPMPKALSPTATRRVASGVRGHQHPPNVSPAQGRD